MGDDGWLLEDGPKWCSILVSTTEVRTTLLFYIYGSWVRVRELPPGKAAELNSDTF